MTREEFEVIRAAVAWYGAGNAGSVSADCRAMEELWRAVEALKASNGAPEPYSAVAGNPGEEGFLL